MRWDKNKKAKVAAIIMDKSKTIADNIVAANLDRWRHKRDVAVVEYFWSIGFESASTDDWDVQKDKNGLNIKSCSRSHLCFSVTTNCVMKVGKDIAEKILVFGLP